MDTGCNKINTVSQGTSAIKVIGNREDNNFAGFVNDKSGNIYTIENQDKAIASNDSFFVIKTDPALNVIWRKPIFLHGGLNSGGIIDIGEGLIVQMGSSSANAPQLIIARMDYDGNLKWEKTLPMPFTGEGIAGPNQKCLFSGDDAYGAPFAIETDTGGNIIWTHSYTKGYQSPDQTCRSCSFTKDGGIAFMGFTFWYDTSGYSYQEAKIIKTDGLGNILWTDSIPIYALPNISNIQFLTNAETADGHIVCTLGSNGGTDGTNFNLAAVIYDKDGKNRKIIDLNTHFYFGSVGGDAVFNFFSTSDNSFYAGSIIKTTGTETHYKISIAKFDANLNKLWNQTYGGNYDLLTGAVIPYNDGGFLIGSTTAAFGKGRNGNDLLLMRADANGNLVK